MSIDTALILRMIHRARLAAREVNVIWEGTKLPRRVPTLVQVIGANGISNRQSVMTPLDAAVQIDRFLPDVPRWRMVVRDADRDGVFRVLSFVTEEEYRAAVERNPSAVQSTEMSTEAEFLGSWPEHFGELSWA
jgi:hypothetical protein